MIEVSVAQPTIGSLPPIEHIDEEMLKCESCLLAKYGPTFKEQLLAFGIDYDEYVKTLAS